MINKFQKEMISFINDVDSLKEWNISSEGKNLKIEQKMKHQQES